MNDPAGTKSQKRAREADDVAENAQPSERVAFEPKYVQDETFYQEDGDCTLLVENTLFKLHRFLFTRDSPVFRTMLQKIANGSIVKLDERLDDFRSLCWILHAYPNDILDQSKEDTFNLSRMISVFDITHKYQFSQYRDWSRNMINFDNLVKHGTPKIFTKLLSILAHCDCSTESCNPLRNQSFGKLAWQAWVKQLVDNPTQPSKDALDSAETLGWRDFQGAVYYLELLRMHSNCTPANGTTTVDPKNNYNPSQLLCLHRGFWSLSQYWRGLRIPPTQLTPKPGHHQVCIQAWDEMWKQGHQLASDDGVWDPLGSLRRLWKTNNIVLANETSADENCSCHFRKEARDIYYKMAQSLADHFLGAAREDGMKDTSSLAQTSGQQRGKNKEQSQADEDSVDSDGSEDQSESSSEDEENNMDLDVAAAEQITDADSDSDSGNDKKETRIRSAPQYAESSGSESDSPANDDNDKEESSSSSDSDRHLTRNQRRARQRRERRRKARSAAAQAKV